MNLDTKVTLGLIKPLSGKDLSVSQLVANTNCNFSSTATSHYPPYPPCPFNFSTLNSKDHVAARANPIWDNSSNILPSTSNIQVMNQIRKSSESIFTSNSSFANHSELPLNFVERGENDENKSRSQRFQDLTYSGSINLNSASQLVNFSDELRSLALKFDQPSHNHAEDCDSEQSPYQPEYIFPFVSGKFVFYENNQSDDSNSTKIEKSFSGCKTDREVSREADEALTRQHRMNIPEILDSEKETKENSAESENCKASQAPGKDTLFSSIRDISTSLTECKKILDSNSSIPFIPTQLDPVKSDASDVKEFPISCPNSNLQPFKMLTPTTVVENFLNNPENMSYEELYRRTTNIALLMTQLQDEARKIDKELYDYEVARKSEQQIAAEEIRIVKEQQQKKDDAIFDILLKKYGTFTRSSIEEWTEFHEKFYKINSEKNSDYCRILPFLRNPQFIGEFHKRTFAKLKAQSKACIFKLTNTVDSPPTKSEQKAMEEADRRKRKPAIDPLIFDDRKMADVYGLTYKVGDAFIGNQPLKDRNENLRDANTSNGADENSRPKRTRGKRGNCDSDQSDYTPVASDADDNFRIKRSRTKKVPDDKIAIVYPVSKTASPSGSRETTPNTGPKVFASGKRVGRPPGSKTQVKLPSKLKSVQAAGEAPENNYSDDRPESHGSSQADKRSQSIDDFMGMSGGDQISDKPTPRKKHAGGRPRKKILVDQEVSELSKLKTKSGRPKKHANLKEAEESKKVQKSKIKGNTCQSDKTPIPLRKDQDILPSTEIDEEDNRFPPCHSSHNVFNAAYFSPLNPYPPYS